MADIKKFERSKERINEILKYLMLADNHENNPYIQTLQQSIRIIDLKMEEFQTKDEVQRQSTAS